jgi:hypothetical protein
MDAATEIQHLLGRYKDWEATDMITVGEQFTERSTVRAAAQAATSPPGEAAAATPYRIALRTDLVARYRYGTLERYIAQTQRAVVASEGGVVVDVASREEWQAVTPHATVQTHFTPASELGIAHTLLQEHADAQVLIRQITTTIPPLSDSLWSHRCRELLGYLRRRSSELEAIFLAAAQKAPLRRRRHLLHIRTPVSGA